MSMPLECVVIGNTEFSVQERLLTSDPISQTCCRRQYIRYRGHSFFYNEWFSYLKASPLEEHLSGYSPGDLTINEIPFYPVIFLSNYLSQKGLRTECVNHFDSGKERISRLLEQEPKVIVISIGASSNSLPLLKIVKFVRSLQPDVKIVVSGQYIYNKWATSDSEEWYQSMRVIGSDYYVINIPGERAIHELVRGLIDGTPVTGLKNIFIMDGGTPLFNGLESMDSELDSYCIDWDAMGGQILGSVVAMNTSKGCPYRCSFCNFPIKNKVFQMSSVETIERQLRQLAKMGVQFIIFNDDTFNVPNKRFKDLCKMMIENRFNFQWFCYFRLKETDEETIILMKESGCRGVFLGIESADDGILENMNKLARRKDYERGLDLLNKHGIMSFAFFLVGFPGETEETVRSTVEFIETAGITFYTANLWYADSSTPIYKDKTRYGLTGKDFNWSHLTMDSRQASVWTDHLFLNVKKAIWIPNENFGFQGVPYLMSKGYSIEQITALLRDAAVLVSGNLVSGDANPEAVIEEMRQVLGAVTPVVQEEINS
ncbi:radical SAM protein [Paenibacillus sp. S150]|uniref:radical SAM protein n=1 Tax=Paenibacillus sp. S150 TaxID=2749826 RepID=UPI001C560C4C|nr:radical SAM protein [Paenibacillus sp. S150]MBW4080398.1 radical SAM protein [Paenibacillus sp. S150]